MGRGIAALVDHELAFVLSDSNGRSGSAFDEQAQRCQAEREAALTKREGELAEAEDRLRQRSEHLRDREREVEAREWRLEVANKLASRAAEPRVKVGRNESCPCGNFLKYKHCHGGLSEGGGRRFK